MFVIVRRVKSQAAAGLILLIVTLACAREQPRNSLGPIGTEGMAPATLLAALESPGAIEPDTMRAAPPAASQDDPLWPLTTYLLGEERLRRGETGAARALFAELSEWSAGDPLGDGWGGSGLAAVALWHWARLLGEGAAAGESLQAEIGRALAAAESILDARLIRGMFSTSIVSSLPQLQEDILRQLARIAWHTGDQDRALPHFFAYLRIARSRELTSVEERMQRALIERGLISEESFALFQARRLLALGSPREARDLARSVLTSEQPQARAEARILLATIEQRLDAKAMGSARAPVAALLRSAYQEATAPDTAELALYEHSKLIGRGGPGQDLERRDRDLQLIRERFPRGNYVDDALLDLARRKQADGDLDAAFALFTEIRTLPGGNDYLHTATFQPAMLLFGRARPGDHETAYEILAGLKEAEPEGPYQLISTFWMARLAQALGNQKTAEGLFRELVDRAPYEYQGLRARMHLRVGAAARSLVAADSGTCRELRHAFERSSVERDLSGESPYHRRLSYALASGLYRQGLDGEIALRSERQPPQRLESLSVSEFVKLESRPRIAILLALRQDALAARDRPDSASSAAANRLRIAAAVKGKDNSLDTPLALRLAFAAGEQSGLRWQAQRDPRYLAAAFPPVFIEEIAAQGRQHGVPPELLYAIARRESLFFPAALSPVAALGLYQFMHATFDGLDRKHGLLTDGVSWDAYLLDPRRSIHAGALLFAETLKRQERLSGRLGGPVAAELFSIMEHNAGYGNVRAWREELAETGPVDDLEFVIDNIRAAQTRVFTRNVLADLIVAKAAGIFGSECGTGESKSP